MIRRSMLPASDIARMPSCGFIHLGNDRRAGEVSSSPDLLQAGEVNLQQSSDPRRSALARAEQWSPFLRESLRALPAIARQFERHGAEAAVELALAAQDA